MLIKLVIARCVNTALIMYLVQTQAGSYEDMFEEAVLTKVSRTYYLQFTHMLLISNVTYMFDEAVPTKVSLTFPNPPQPSPLTTTTTTTTSHQDPRHPDC